MRRSAVRDRRAILFDWILYWVAIICLMVSVALYVIREAAKDQRVK